MFDCEKPSIALPIIHLQRRKSNTEVANLRHPVSGAGTVAMDPDGLRQVLTNLLDNAVRYTPDGGRIVVTVPLGASLGRMPA